MIVLIATQRSGTNMLRRILHTHRQICARPEVFDESATTRAEMPEGVPVFVDYLFDEVTKNPSLALPHERPGVVERYLEMLEAAVTDEGTVTVVDVKYNSLHHAESLWWRPHSAPRMLSIFRQRNDRIVHLIRRNHLGTALSELRTRKTGVFTVPASQTVKPTSFSVDPKTIGGQIEVIKQATSMVRRWLEESGLPVLEVACENLFVDKPGSPFDRSELTRIADFVDVSVDGFNLTPKTRKIAPLDLREEIRNIDEVKAALAGTEYQDIL